MLCPPHHSNRVAERVLIHSYVYSYTHVNAFLNSDRSAFPNTSAFLYAVTHTQTKNICCFFLVLVICFCVCSSFYRVSRARVHTERCELRRVCESVCTVYMDIIYIYECSLFSPGTHVRSCVNRVRICGECVVWCFIFRFMCSSHFNS